MFASLTGEWTDSTPLGSSDVTDSPTADFSESLIISLGPWRRGASSDTGSVSALGFGFDLFRDPMKEKARAEGEATGSLDF